MKIVNTRNHNDLWPFILDKMSKEERKELFLRVTNGRPVRSISNSYVLNEPAYKNYMEYVDEMNQKYKGIYKGPNSLKK